MSIVNNASSTDMVSDPRVHKNPAGLGKRALRIAVPPTVVAVAVVVLWYIAALAVNSTVFPGPARSVETLADDLSSAAFQSNVISTVVVLALSYAGCVVIGSFVGFILGMLPFWSDVFSPLLYASYSIPKITLFPLFLLFLGISEFSRGAFAFVSGVLPMVLIVMGATASVDRIYLKLAASLRLGVMSLIRYILIPSILPALATGMRLTFGLTFLGLILAQMFAGNGGLGYELLQNVSLVRMDAIVGEVLLVAAIAVVPTALLKFGEQRIYSRFGGSGSEHDGN